MSHHLLSTLDVIVSKEREKCYKVIFLTIFAEAARMCGFLLCRFQKLREAKSVWRVQCEMYQVCHSGPERSPKYTEEAKIILIFN